jgi:S-adenosyl-L-methionine hydrolase (adenosine-forming)
LSLITISTDFGWDDPYAGIMKGVILGINPQVRLVDLTHGLSHHHLLEAAFKLHSAYPYFPVDSIHLVVVDPGVGGERRLIGIQSGESIWIGPDNGLFTLVVKENAGAAIIHLHNERYFLHSVSRTFHGRDIMAPVAAHLSLGVPLTEMGSPVTDPVLISLPDPEQGREGILGQVLWADHFGNLITNIHRKDLAALADPVNLKIIVGADSMVGIRENYGQEIPGTLMALFGSSGYLEIACNLSSAAEKIGYAAGQELKVRVIP